MNFNFLGKNSSNRVIINGKTYFGKNIVVKGDSIIVDGNLIDDIQSKKVNISINSEVQDLSVGSCERIVVNGNCKNLTSSSGDICIDGNVEGNVNSSSGDIECKDVLGNITTSSGDVKASDVKGDIKTKSGDIIC